MIKRRIHRFLGIFAMFIFLLGAGVYVYSAIPILSVLIFALAIVGLLLHLINLK
jgi:hypothetical protein